MTTTDWRKLCADLANALDAEIGYKTKDGKWITSEDVTRARAALAQPEPEVGPSDEELLATLNKATADFPPRHPEAEALNAVEYPLALELRKARAVLTRWGRPAPASAGEVAELVAALRSTAQGLESQAYTQTAALLTRAADLLEHLASPACLALKPSPEMLEAFQDALPPGRIEPLPDYVQAAPVPVAVSDPTDAQLLATVDAVTVTLPPLPKDAADAHGRITYDVAWRVAMARAVLERWGRPASSP